MAKVTNRRDGAPKKVTNQGDSHYSRYNKKNQTKKKYRGQGR